MPTRIPKPEDFNHLSPSLHISLIFPEIPETTTAILILFHGLGDSEASFASFAKSINLPGVLAISVRGVSPIPPALLGSEASGPPRNFHWGDDLTLSPSTGDLDTDPGFSKAEGLVLGKLIRETLIEKCGWDTDDIVLFGFGQGGSLALGLSSKIRQGERVVDVTEGNGAASTTFKGVVTIGGPLPTSMIPTISARGKSRTPILACHGRSSENLDEDAMDLLRKEFAFIREVKWNKSNDDMPRNKDEMVPIMRFFAEKIRG